MLSSIRALVRRPDRKHLGRSAISLGVLAVLWSTSLTVVGGLAPAGAQFGSLDFQHCANENPVLGDCDWINGNLNDGRSRYFEGMSVPHRILVSGVEASPADAHSIDFVTQATKSDAHGYDFLTSYAQANQAHQDFIGIPLALNPCGPDFSSAGLEGTCAGVIPPSPDSNCVAVEVPDTDYLSEVPVPGSSLLDRIEAFEDVYGNRTITICGDAPISSPVLSVTFSKGPNSDGGGAGMTANYHLGWTSTSETVLVQFAAHLAVGVGLAGWGAGAGAQDVPGSTNDAHLNMFDGGGVAAMTRTIQGGDLLTSVSRINVTKIVQGGDGDDFPFSFDAPGVLSDTNFLLDDLQTTGFTPLSPGMYVITETDTLGLAFEGIECNDGAEVAVNNGTRTVTITLGPNETVSCTFTNSITNGTSVPEINITKVVDGGDGTEVFAFTFDPPGADNTQDFDLMNQETDNFGDLTPGGQYIVTEGDEPGFELVSIDCNLGTVDAAAGTVTVTVQTGDVVNCTYTNAAVPPPDTTGDIVITKEAELADGVSFGFNIDAPGADNTEGFELLAGESAGFNDLEAGGPYVVTELDETGFDLVAITCNDGADATILGATVSITVVAGETVECTYTNRPTPPEPGTGRIIVAKVADDYDTNTEFPFASNFDGLPADGADFTLEAGEETAFDLAPGTYAVSELVPAGWDLVSATCTGGNTVGAIELAEDEIVTCTFTNEREDSSNDDNGYDDYPGDDDFEFDTPFDDADDNTPPAPQTQVAGGNAGVTPTGGQPSGNDQLSVAGDTASPQPGPAEGDPAALAELPRTGAGIRHLTMAAGILLILGGLASQATPRRRKAYQA